MDSETMRAALVQLAREAQADRASHAEQLKKARAFMAAGRFDLAEPLYRDVAELRPRDGKLQAEVGRVLWRHGRLEGAFEALRRALRVSPSDASLHRDVGRVLAEGAGTESAYLASFWPSQPPSTLSGARQRAQELVEEAESPAQSYALLGHLHLAQRDAAAAVEAYRQAAEHDPSVWRPALAVALEAAGQGSEAEVVRGVQQLEEGRAERAAATIERGIREGGRSLEAYEGLARAYLAQQRDTDAANACREGARWFSDSVSLRRTWVRALAQGGYLEDAKRLARRFGASHPDGFFDYTEHLTLPSVYESPGEVERARSAFEAGLRHLETAVELDAPGGLRRWEGLLRAPSFYLAYQGENDRALQVRYARLVRRLVGAIAGDLPAPRLRFGDRDRLRVGFASPFWYSHTVARFFSGWITERDRDRVEAYVYSLWGPLDVFSGRLRVSADTFRHLPLPTFPGGLRDVAAQILDDELDVLVYPSVGMHPASGALASLRLAPVQAVGWGHPTTTGLPTVDYFLSSAAAEPAGAEAHYTERLALLPGIGVHVEPFPASKRQRTRAHFGLAEEDVVFLSPQSLFKYHPQYDAVYPAIARRVPRAVFVFFEHPAAEMTRTFVRRLEAAFWEAGLDPSRHLAFMKHMDMPDFLALNALADVFLDSLGWTGGMTALDALSAGLPPVTMAGPLMRGRQTLSYLQALELPHLVAATVDEYVEMAARLGTDPEERAALRASILARADGLYRDAAPVRALEAFYERAAAEAVGVARSGEG